MEAPLAKLKSPELHEYLNEQQSVLEMLDIASLREECARLIGAGKKVVLA